MALMRLSPRKTGNFVSQTCKDVTISDDDVDKTAKLLAQKFQSGNYSMQAWKQHTLHPKVADHDSLNLIFAFDTLNFSFWPDVEGEKFMVCYDGKPYTGYWSMVAALRRALDNGIPVTFPEYMANASLQDFKEIFKSNSKVEVPLIEKRLNCFNEAGKKLLEKFNGSFSNCIKMADKDVKKLLEIIVSNFDSYRDEATYAGENISFYKRAQILIADVWLCFEGKGLGEFKNIDELTMFADYRVPQSLEYFGILQYSNDLKEILKQRTVLPPGHEMEIAIRGCSIEAIERLTKVIKSMVSDERKAVVNSVTVDNYLWDYARDHRTDMNHLPIHLVRTIYY